MPSHEFELNPDTPLFDPTDPLTIPLTDIDGKKRKYLCKERAGALQLEPADAPITWYVQQLTHQIVDEEQDDFRAALVGLIEGGRIKYDPSDPDKNPLMAMLNWVLETRTAAEQGTLARVTRRPTPARKRSGR